MQTFLPYADFTESARALDYRRLGKQRVEAKQILNALAGLSKGWTNHPATRMWRGHEYYLALYGFIVCREWIARGYNDSLTPWFFRLLSELPDTPPPPWLDNADLHLSHQSNLIRKDPEFYAPLFPGVPSDLPYVWPVWKEAE